MVAAVLCIVLLFIIQDSVGTPFLFQLSIVLVALGMVGYILVTLGNDLVHWRHGLLRAQTPRTLFLIVTLGGGLALARLLHLTFVPDHAKWDFADGTAVPTSTEHLQRWVIGWPYFLSRFFGLDMWGWTIGFVAFTTFILGGCFACCVFNCCGTVRLWQSVFRRRRDAMPFMDMVSNRFTLSSFNALLFVYPFCILSTFVIGGSLLIDPARSFAPAGPPSSLRMLCSPIVTSRLHGLATDAVHELAGRFIPAELASPDQVQAVSTVMLDLAWRHAFEPIEAECDNVLARPLIPSASALRIPRVAFALRDGNGLAAGVPADAVLHVALVRQPSNTTTSDGASDGGGDGGGLGGGGAYDAERPWCWKEMAPWLGCAETARRCATRARLAGRVVAPADPTAGVVVFDQLWLEAVEEVGGSSDGGSAAPLELCGGDYELDVALRSWRGDTEDVLDNLWWRPRASGRNASNATGGAEAAEGLTTVDPAAPAWRVPRADELGPPQLSTSVRLRLVPSLNDTSVVEKSWSVELPAFFNTSTMTRTSSTVSYTQRTRLHSVATTITTNTTTVAFDWMLDAPANGTNATADGASAGGGGGGGFLGLGSHSYTPVWPTNHTPAIEVSETTSHVRPPAHLLSFVRAPPRGAVRLSQPFEVALRLTTEGGMSLAGEQVCKRADRTVGPTLERLRGTL